MVQQKKKQPTHDALALGLLSTDQFRGRLLYVEQGDCFYYYEGKYWRPLTPLELRSAICHYLVTEHLGYAITDGVIGDITRLLVYLLNARSRSFKDLYISFEDGLLDPGTFERFPHSPERHATLYLPHTYDEVLKAECPKFNSFLTDVLVGMDGKTHDPKILTLVQEMVGCLLSPSLDAATAFFLVGEGSNGKSILSSIIQGIIGDEYVSAMSIELLTTRPFAAANLIGKKVNLCNEEESKYLKSDKFKALISGDLIAAERKFGNPFEFSPTAKYLFSSNNLPTFEGLNYGLRRRLKLIPFNRRFAPEERKPRDAYIAELLTEKPGIVRWALDGLKRLISRNWVFSDGGDAVAQAGIDFENEMSAAVRFVRENYVVDDKAFITNEALYAAYKVWSDDNGRKAMNSQNFKKDILRNIKGVESKRNFITNPDGSRVFARGKNLAPLVDSDPDDIPIEQINF